MKKTLFTFAACLFLVGGSFAQGPSSVGLKEANDFADTELGEYLKTYAGKEVMTFLKSNDKKVKLRVKNYTIRSKSYDKDGRSMYVLYYQYKDPLNLHEFPEKFCILLDGEEVVELRKKGDCVK